MARTFFAQSLTLSSVILLVPSIVSLDKAVAQSPNSVPPSVGETRTLIAFEPLIDAPKQTRGGGRRLFEPPPGQDAPVNTRGGGRRNDNVCSQDRVKIPENAKATTPPKKVGDVIAPILPSQKWGLTALERPTFLVYVPRTSAKEMEFTLEESATPTTAALEMYRMKVAMPTTPGVVQLSLPAEAPPLAVGKDYTWRVSFACKAVGAGPEDPFVEGYVRRVEADRTGAIAIEQAIPLETVKQLAKAGLWYDASAQLAALKQASTNPTLQTAWKDLLADIGMEALATVPIN